MRKRKVQEGSWVFAAASAHWAGEEDRQILDFPHLVFNWMRVKVHLQVQEHDDLVEEVDGW